MFSGLLCCCFPERRFQNGRLADLLFVRVVSEGEGDVLAVFSVVRKYYPLRWPLEYLRLLVKSALLNFLVFLNSQRGNGLYGSDALLLYILAQWLLSNRRAFWAYVGFVFE